MDTAYKAADTNLQGQIDALEANAYDDTAVRASIQSNTDAISAMDTAYKAADTTLDGKITANANAISAIEQEQDQQDTAIQAAAAAAEAAQQTADSKLAVTGTCPAGETCYLDSTGAIQVAVKTYVKPTAQPTQQ